MSNADVRGRFIWHELMTTDTDAAGHFYSRVVPWKTQPSPMPSYTLWMSGNTRTGGLMALPAGGTPGTPPSWLVYVGTPDVDATVEAVKRLGGRVLKSASDIPNVGRFAVLSDPQGAAFAAFTPAPGSGEGMTAGGGVGDFAWHELATTDPDAALRFYSELFGWSKGAAHDMGAMGVYQLVSHGGKDVGGIYKARDISTPPSWLSYVQVTDAGKAANAAKAAGGRVLHGPVEVPGGSWIVMMLDPQGGAFAVVEPPKAAKAPQPAPAEKGAAAAGKPPKPAPAPKPSAPPKPAAAPEPKPAAPAQAAPAKAAPAPKPAPLKAAPAKAAPTKAKAAKAPARKKKKGGRKAAAKPARKKATRKTVARKPAKRAAARKSTSARGSAARKGAKRVAAKRKGKKRR